MEQSRRLACIVPIGRGEGSTNQVCCTSHPYVLYVVLQASEESLQTPDESVEEILVGK